MSVSTDGPDPNNPPPCPLGGPGPNGPNPSPGGPSPGGPSPKLMSASPG